MHPADVLAAQRDAAEREKTRLRIFSACHRVLHRNDPPPAGDNELTLNGTPFLGLPR